MKYLYRVLLIVAILFVAGIAQVHAEMIYTSDGNGNRNMYQVESNNGNTVVQSTTTYDNDGFNPTTPGY